MSVAFATPRQRGKGEITPAAIQKLLDENNQLIQCIMDYQSKGKSAECSQYQQMLHRNLVYLATIADSNQNMQSLLPAPPTQSMTMGSGSMNQSGMTQLAHGHSMAADGMVGGGAPVPHMQNQMNGQMPGSNYMPVQGPGQAGLANSSVSMQASSHSSMGAYSHSVPSLQAMPVQSQVNVSQGQSMGSYGPRPNINMQPSQGNPQYGQQQDAYQQGPPQQQGYPAQQYTAQQGYAPQQQGYGASQGAPGQYSSYPQGQGQQYGGYRPPQPGPPQQQQRPYGYEQNMQ
ncbi:protein SSXT isoform X4 [Rhinoraja longicauda]